jgi:hypothetical protein
MVDMGKYITVSSTFPHIIRKSIIKKKKMNKNTTTVMMTTTTTADRIQSSSVVVSSNASSHSSPRSVTTTDRMKHNILSDASKCSVEIVPCPPSQMIGVIAADHEDDNNNDLLIDYSSPRRTSTVHNDRLLHSLGCFGEQFISGVIRRLFASPASAKYGISTNAVYTIGNMLRNVCEWELPFELSEEVYLDTINDDNSVTTGTAVAWRVHSRVDQLWAGIEHSLDRWVVDASKVASRSSSSVLSSSSTGPPILNGPMAIKLVEKIVHSTLWEMGIHSLRFDIGIHNNDDDDDSLCSDTRTTTGWTTPGAFGCCQCTPLEPF